ncbi:DNA polymerase IV [Marinigracilibium pacificum]|uniref:DNA polymerase IV n=1 Tax=Marinigracilibium pacificum TaxID=2729599 RepID=A0A848IYN1_9BACT|nr:DNA polymerase IV [Marinigracilibium pacificum]NMM48431.1 DNA polymerase IV [Marinigracilibium pacificum]
MNPNRLSSDVTNKIIHVDMDAFYASVEQRDNPSLKNKPVAVGGGATRGVVAAASYEARKYGVKSAMPGIVAKRKCPDLIFVKPRFEVYKEVSNEIREIFYEYTDLVEPLSLDEAFLDVTKNKKGLPSATLIAREIKVKIKEKTGLTASAGISINKFLAKTATDIHKPNGLTLIPPDKIEPFIEKLPIEKFFGVGKSTAEKMHKMGILHGKDLKSISLERLKQSFGKQGQYFYNIARGIDNRPVVPDRTRKSVSAERTFEKDHRQESYLQEFLSGLIDKIYNWSIKNENFGRTLTVKIKDNQFKVFSKSYSSTLPFKEKELIEKVASELLGSLLDQKNYPPVRLLGFGISSLTKGTETDLQLTLDF